MIFLPKAIQKARNVLPKTGQITSYQAGDDGDYEAGWWRKRLNANNKTRFVLKTIAGDNVICDYATRLMWLPKAQDQMIINWSNAIIWAEGLSWAGFSDWRLPNIFELVAVHNFNDPNTNFAILDFEADKLYWSSTTYVPYTLAAYFSTFTSGTFVELTTKADTEDMYARACREF
jgi:hypothetical protein